MAGEYWGRAWTGSYFELCASLARGTWAVREKKRTGRLEVPVSFEAGVKRGRRGVGSWVP